MAPHNTIKTADITTKYGAIEKQQGAKDLILAR